jgi:hypothetical protein
VRTAILITLALAMLGLATLLSASHCYDTARQLRCAGADDYWRATEPLRI